MSEVKRYSAAISFNFINYAEMREDSAGGYVRYEDYLSLLAEYHTLNRCPACCPKPEDKDKS